MFSLDCFLLKSGLDIRYFDKFPIFYIKTILYSLIPILVGSLGAFLWFCIYYGAKKVSQRVIEVRTNIIVTYYIVTFIVYPVISTASFSLFNCLELDDGNSYLKKDFKI